MFGGRAGDVGLEHGCCIRRRFILCLGQPKVLVGRVYRIDHSVSVHDGISRLGVGLSCLPEILFFNGIAHHVLVRHGSVRLVGPIVCIGRDRLFWRLFVGFSYPFIVHRFSPLKFRSDLHITVVHCINFPVSLVNMRAGLRIGKRRGGEEFEGAHKDARHTGEGRKAL